MLHEAGEYRDPPSRPYRPGAACLGVSRDAVAATLASLRRCGALESCVFWYGPRDGDQAEVAAVVTPRQAMSWGNYHVGPAALSEMVGLLDDDWKPLAQIHSHPGKRVEHSHYDDVMASSRRALSIVFPSYGRWQGAWPIGIGVHEYQQDYWHLLDAKLAARRVRLTHGRLALVRDLRR